MKRVPSSLVALALAAQAALAQGAAKKVRIAVQDFDYSSVQGQVQEIFGNDVDVGRGIANLVQDALAKSGKYDVAQRINVPEGQRADAAGAAQRAQSAGVDAVVMGSVIGYGKSENQTGGVNVHVGGFGFGGIGKKTTIAFVNLQVTFVAAGNPAPAAVAMGQGTSKGSGTTVLGDVSAAGLSANGEIDMTKTDFQKTTLGKAQNAAIDALVQDMLAKYEAVAAAQAPPTAPAAAMPMPAAPAAAPAAPAAPLPSAYSQPVTGPFAWNVYSFQGTEHFKYNVTLVDDGTTKPGVYTLDASKAGANIQVNVVWTLGTDAGSGTLILQPGQAMISPMELASLGPAGALLFNPALGYMFMGHQWAVGAGWSMTHEGETTSFKVESPCAVAGVSGLKGVIRKNNVVVWDFCVSPNVGLPLSETFNNDDGSAHFTMTAVEFHP